MLETGTERDLFRELFSRQNATDVRSARLEESVEGLVAKMDGLAKSVEKVADRISKGNDWGVLAAWASVILAVVGSCGWLALQPLREDIAELKESAESAETTARLVERLDERSRWQAVITIGKLP